LSNRLGSREAAIDPTSEWKPEVNSEFIIENVEQLAIHLVDEFLIVGSGANCIIVAGLSVVAAGVVAEELLNISFVSVRQLLPS